MLVVALRSPLNGVVKKNFLWIAFYQESSLLGGRNEGVDLLIVSKHNQNCRQSRRPLHFGRNSGGCTCVPARHRRHNCLVQSCTLVRTYDTV